MGETRTASFSVALRKRSAPQNHPSSQSPGCPLPTRPLPYHCRPLDLAARFRPRSWSKQDRRGPSWNRLATRNPSISAAPDSRFLWLIRWEGAHRHPQRQVTPPTDAAAVQAPVRAWWSHLVMRQPRCSLCSKICSAADRILDCSTGTAWLLTCYVGISSWWRCPRRRLFQVSARPCSAAPLARR